MEDITIQEVVNFHIEISGNQTVEETINNIVENLAELAKRDLGEKLGAKCIYACFTEPCDFCGQCVGEVVEDFDNLLGAKDAHETYSSMCDDYRTNVLGHSHPI